MGCLDVSNFALPGDEGASQDGADETCIDWAQELQQRREMQLVVCLASSAGSELPVVGCTLPWWYAVSCLQLQDLKF